MAGGLQYYKIAGRQVGSHHLAFSIFCTLVGGITYAVSGPKRTPAVPKIEASSSDEANFIQKFLEENSGESEKKAATH